MKTNNNHKEKKVMKELDVKMYNKKMEELYHVIDTVNDYLYYCECYGMEVSEAFGFINQWFAQPTVIFNDTLSVKNVLDYVRKSNPGDLSTIHKKTASIMAEIARTQHTLLRLLPYIKKWSSILLALHPNWEELWKNKKKGIMGQIVYAEQFIMGLCLK
ncbi:hypothetical protein [Bacteroides sp.]|uniref:hypothetical protein n=1 Tax=Bacteroides sp. TaxID=29523 RepID=UPI0011DD9E2E|nr:hypothetical protein [Bacteroides sp.]